MAETRSIQRVSRRVKLETLEADLRDLCRLVHPSWNEQLFCYEKLSGGLLNEIYKCWLHNNEDSALIVRIYTQQDVCGLVDRNKEIIGMQVGHAAGVSEPLHVIFDNGLVYGYAPGKTVNWGLLWDDHVARKYIGSIARFHMTDPAMIGIVNQEGNKTSINRFQTPGLLERMRNVIKDIPEEFKHFPERRQRIKSFWGKDRLQEEIDLLEKHFAKFQFNVTFSHNDVWVNNVVYDRKTDTLSLLDFEYSDYNYEAFDVGMLFNCFQYFEAYNDMLPDNIMKPSEEELKLPRDQEHRQKLTRFYLEEKCRFLGKDRKDYTEQEFNTIFIEAEMLSLVTNLYWCIFGLAQSDDPKVTWDLFDASGRAFQKYCDQREKLFHYQPCHPST